MLRLVALLCCVGLAAADGGCDSPGWSWSPVFWRPEGQLFTNGKCTGSPAASCAFTGAYSLSDAGPSVTITCPAGTPGAFLVVLSFLGASEQATGAANTCVGVTVGSLGVGAQIDCKPGLLLVLVPTLLLLLLVCVCCCCARCCGCCGGGARTTSTTSSIATRYVVLPSGAEPAGFYSQQQGRQHQPRFYVPPQQ